MGEKMLFENNQKLDKYHTIGVLGQKGCGKTYFLMNFINELQGKNVFAFDTLGVFQKEKMQGCFLLTPHISPAGFKELKRILDAMDFSKNRLKIVFNLCGLSVENCVLLLDFLCEYVLLHKIACAFIVDEISDYCRQGKREPYSKVFERMTRTGRNYGITPILFSSQRTQLVEKDLLGLCDCYVVFRLLHQLDRNKIRELYGMNMKEFTKVDHELMQLQKQECLLYSYDDQATTKTKTATI